MANVRVQDLLRNEQKKNYVSCMIALQKTGEAVLPFTEGKLQQVHQQISQQLGNQNPCQQLCSRTKRDVNRWCITCGLWRQALIRFHTNPLELRWLKLQSWEWPKHHMNLVEVFMLQNWDKANMDPNDLSVALTVWKKCSVFPATILPLAGELQKSRNTVAHTTSLDENVKLTVFNDIKKVIHHADVVNYLPNPLEIQNIITDLENGDLFKFENELKEIMNSTNEVKERLHTIDKKLNMVHEHQTNTFRTMQWIVIATCMVVLAAVLVSVNLPALQTIFKRSQFEPPMEKTGCLQEYSPLFSTSTKLVDYFKNHEPLVGRVWMFQLLDEQLKNTTKKGILLEADMGYGKSAIAAHITCAKEGDQGMELRKRLIAFHVCKFDVKKTHQAGVFIQRLVSMISNNVPEFNQTISEECLHSFKTGKCDSDPFGCIDECIICSLKRTNISDEGKEYRLIIIDALDECYETFLLEKSNILFNFMESRADRLPSWIKLLVTSRRLPINERLKYNLDKTFFPNFEPRNLNDINLFLNQTFREKNITNFLLAVNADFTQPNQIDNLNRFYQEQFTRWYVGGFNFSKLILEALVTTHLKTSPENIRKVIAFNAIDKFSLSEFEKQLSIIQQFTDIIDGEIEFKHLSVFKWLVEECPDLGYRLSLSSGHQANAHYILHQLNTSNFTFDVTDLLLHIQSANEGSGLQEQFMNIPKKTISRIEKNFSEEPVVRIIKRGKMREIPEILFHRFPGGNHFSAEKISVGFIAAENGYTDALKQLVNHGADIHFRMPTFKNMLTMHDAVEIATYFKHWNYGLLDIAAQHGHTETVKLILQDDLFSSYKLHERNGLNLSPWHLACMFNRTEAVQVFLQFNRSFVDWKCLYIAAEKGNNQIVKLLLEAGISDKCVLCTNEFYWIPNGTARVQGYMVPENDSMYVLFDDWSELSCESALHAAIRQNHLKVVRELLKNSTHSTLHCLDRGGRPALIAALQSNRTEIVRLFLELNNAHMIKVECQEMPVLKDNIQIHHLELVKLTNMKCKAGHGFEHAKSTMSVALPKKTNFTIFDFNRRDEDNCLPIHYAACGNNVDYLHFILQSNKMVFETLLCFNNTNAFHSTIHCRAFDTFLYFINNYGTLSKSKSGFGHNCQQYASYLLKLSNNQEEFAKDANDKTWSKMFKVFIERLHANVSMIQDENGNSMLHDIVKNGHFELLRYLVAKRRNATLELFQSFSLIGQSQITYLAKYMPIRKYVRSEIMFDIFLTRPHSVQQEQKQLSASGYCFSLASRFLNRYGVFKMEDKIAIMQELLKRKSYNLVDIYLKHVMPRDKLFKTKVFATFLDFDSTGYITSHYLVVLLHDINTQQPSSFKRYEILKCSTCYGLRNRCQVHKFTHKISRFQGNFNSNVSFVSETICLGVFKLMISFTDNDVLTSCLNQKGLTVLELAINSKSAALMKLLIDKGVKIKIPPEELLLSSFRQNDHIEKLPVTLLNATSDNSTDLVNYHFHTYEQIMNIFNTTQTTAKNKRDNAHLLHLVMINNLLFLQNPFFLPERNDMFYASFINLYHSQLSKSFICTERSSNFSLIHLLSLHGYTNSIETCVKYFGKNILTCLNIDEFTPLYLSQIYDRTNKTFYTILENSPKKQLKVPIKTAEKHFLYNFVTKFYFSNGENSRQLCFVRYLNIPSMSIYQTIKLYKCLKSKAFSLVEPEILRSFLKRLKFDIIYRSFEELRQAFIKKTEDLKLFFRTIRMNAFVSVVDVNRAETSLSNLMKFRRFICIQFMAVAKLYFKQKNITVVTDEILGCNGKTVVLTRFGKLFIRKTLLKRFDHMTFCTTHLDKIEEMYYTQCFQEMSFVTKQLYKQFFGPAKNAFQNMLLRTVLLQSHHFKSSFLDQRFSKIFSKVNEFKLFSDNAIYRYKYMDAITTYPFVQFSFRHNLTVEFEYHKKIMPNYEYINSSMFSEQIRNAYKKFNNRNNGEN